jgi:hypothetical protein
MYCGTGSSPPQHNALPQQCMQLLHFPSRPYLLTESRDFSSKCPSLRHLTIAMRKEDLFGNNPSDVFDLVPFGVTLHRWLTCTKMMTKFDMEPLLECRTLQRFTLKIRDLATSVNNVWAIILINLVAEWIKESVMEKNDRVVKTDLICSTETGQP